MARKLKTIARMINDEWDGYRATCESSYSNTDRKSAGCRYITSKGKGREGYEIKVYRGDLRIFSHDSSGTYRTNREVEDWVDHAERFLRAGIEVPEIFYLYDNQNWELLKTAEKHRERSYE